MAAHAREFPELAQELRRSLRGELLPGWDKDLPVFPADAKGIATRVASGKVMNAIAQHLPALTGGSADLDPSTHTALAGLGDFEPPAGEADYTQGSLTQGWRRYVGDSGEVLGVERFGASAPAEVLQREYGFSVEEVCRQALALRHA